MVASLVNRQRRGLHHVIVVQRVPAIPGLEIPVLYFAEASDDSLEALAPLSALVDYFIANSARSATWMIQCARCVGMLFDYMQQRRDYFAEIAQNELTNIHRVVLTQFQNHLTKGTVLFTPEGLKDDTGLYWMPHSSSDNTLALVRGLDQFLRWLHQGGYGDHVGTSIDLGTLSFRGEHVVRFLYMARFRREVSMLAHIKQHGSQRQPISRAIVGKATRGLDAPDNVQFPRAYLGRLITEAFVTKRRGRSGIVSEDLTAKLATMLSAFGSLRRSEPLHLWVSDVQRVDGSPTVFLHHPVAALVQHGSNGWMTRHRYLHDYCGMQPRNLEIGKFHAGWKGIKCNKDHWAMLYWLPIPGVEELFWSTFERYMSEVRPPLMRQRLRRGLGDHPFLLVSSGSANHDGDPDSAGDPYTLVASGNAWRRAIGRLQRKYDPTLEVAKRLGTTQHGLRHLYGGILAELGVSEKVIQECMHHISPESQRTYTKPRNESVSAQLTSASKRIQIEDFLDLQPPLSTQI